jgi:RimJ/RimL family protein N-acetyltransferase
MRNYLLETDRLIIRKFLLDDIDLLFKYSQEEITKKELPDEVFENIGNAREIIEYFISNYDSKNPLIGIKDIGTCYGIILKSTNIIIGHIGLIRIDKGIEIGYAIATDYQNKGYATEIISPFVKWAKQEFNIDKIYGIVKDHNVSSWKPLEKNGFKLMEEGKNINYFGGKYFIKIYVN